MSGLDTESLEQVNEMLQAQLKRLHDMERKRPVFETMQVRMAETQKLLKEQLTDPATARVNQSVINLEKSLEEVQANLDAKEIRQKAVLRNARARTASLQRWLEALG